MLESGKQNRGNRIGPHLCGIPPANHERRCTATNAFNGLRCATWAVRGSSYCKTHVVKLREKKVIPSSPDPLTSARKKRGFRFSDICVDPVQKAALAEIEERNEDPENRLSLKASEALVQRQLELAVNVFNLTFAGKLDRPNDDKWNEEIRETAVLKLKEAQRWQKEFLDSSARIEVMRKEIFKDEVNGVSKVVVMQILSLLEKHLGPQHKDPKLTEAYIGLTKDLQQIQTLGSISPKVTITI